MSEPNDEETAEEWSAAVRARQSCHACAEKDAKHVTTLMDRDAEWARLSRAYDVLLTAKEAAEAALVAVRQERDMLEQVAVRASAELRHAWRGSRIRPWDAGLISRAITMLETATTKPAAPAPSAAEEPRP